MAFLTSCGNSDNNQKDSQKQDATASESTEIKSYIKDLNYDKFLKDVWNFEESPNEFIIESDRPCVIDFYATWCGPCKQIAPILEKLAKEYDGKIDFYRVDTDKEQKLSAIFQVRNIPTVFFIKEGEQPLKSVGANLEEYYRGILEKMVSE